jgi:hypothetical protein
LEGELYEDEYASKLAPYPCYDAQGQPIVDAQGGHFHAYVQVVRKTKKLRVRDWKFMDSKKPDNTAYVAPALGVQPGAVAPANVQATFAPQPVAQPAAVAVQPIVPGVVAPPALQPPEWTPAAAAPTTQPAQFTVPATNLPPGV